MNVKIRNKFIEIKYSVSYGLVIFITNYRWFRILEISRYSNTLDKSLSEVLISLQRAFFACHFPFPYTMQSRFTFSNFC